jgi:lipoprotein LpqH
LCAFAAHNTEEKSVKQELLILIVAATIVAGVAGCSNGTKSPNTSSSTTTSPAASGTTSAPATVSGAASPGPGSAKVTIDGQPQNVTGPVVCSTTEGKFSIAIGEPLTGVIVGLEPDASVVHGVGLNTVNGVVLSFTEGVPGNNASATKDGNTYKVTGTATGITEANPPQQVSKPFEIDVTCP